MYVLFSKLKEVLYAVLPIAFIVLVLHFTLTPLETAPLLRFLIGAVLIILGLSIFLLGVDMGITHIGHIMGSAIAKTNRIWIVAVSGIFLGFFISIAEPDLHILAGQVDSVTQGMIQKLSIVVVVSVGIAVFLSVGLVRIIYRIPLYKMLTVLYFCILLLSFLAPPEFLAISFDASGATTGAMTVPFILALAVGISVLNKDSKASEKDSFGLVSIASAGAIIAVMAMSIIKQPGEIASGLEHRQALSASLLSPFLHELPVISSEITLALLPILLIFLVFQKVSFHLTKTAVRKILFGLIFAFVGLVLFLTGVNAGFMDVGNAIGRSIALLDNKAYIIVTGFLLGFVTILAEPAVYVLTQQIEDVTSGYVNRKIVLAALSVGIGCAVALSTLRILIPGIQLWHYLLPGYLISLILPHFAPKLFVGIAFDAGGVASGPMTATFILAFMQGAAGAYDGANVLADGFGMIAMVALTPIIALQVLGLIFKIKSERTGVDKNAR